LNALSNSLERVEDRQSKWNEKLYRTNEHVYIKLYLIIQLYYYEEYVTEGDRVINYEFGQG